jgi:hypothetical protein
VHVSESTRLKYSERSDGVRGAGALAGLKLTSDGAGAGYREQGHGCARVERETRARLAVFLRLRFTLASLSLTKGSSSTGEHDGKSCNLAGTRC